MITTMNSNNTYFDGESLLNTVISVLPDHMQRAAQLCQSITDPDLQWQTYLDAIALFGVEAWLRDRTPHLSLSTQHSQLLQHSGDAALPLVNRLDAGDFHLCILSTGTLTDTHVPVPTAAVEDSSQIPHFYVLVNVEEEYEQVRVAGILRADQLSQHQLDPATDGTYAFALDWFDTNADDLLLYLRCLEPSAIARPNVRERAINVGAWLRDRLDDVAAELSWVLLPPPAAPVMLSTSTPTNQTDTVVSELMAQGMDIPSHARGAYHDLCSGTIDLRLYAVTWESGIPEPSAEWTLLLILGAPPNSPPPLGVRMIVRDDQQPLFDRTLTGQSAHHYLFAQLAGEPHEQFWVTVNLHNGVTVTLPPFRFDRTNV